jgi:hypothetical protein
VARRARIAALALALALGAAAPAAAQDMPRGQFGMTGALRKNLGELAQSYGLGYLWGFMAGYQVTRPEEALSLGLAWQTLFGHSQFFGWLGQDDAEIASGSLGYLEMSIGLKLRYLLPSETVPRFVFVTTGGSLLRTDVPVPPSDSRLHGGAYVGAGYEQYTFGDLLGSLEVRYGLFGPGPASVSFMLSLSVGH